jgi:hypothetical protein
MIAMQAPRNATHSYERHATECRQMALQMKDAVHKKQLLEMADTWHTLTEARRQQLLKQANGDRDLAKRLEEEPINAPALDGWRNAWFEKPRTVPYPAIRRSVEI